MPNSSAGTRPNRRSVSPPLAHPAAAADRVSTGHGDAHDAIG